MEKKQNSGFTKTVNKVFNEIPVGTHFSGLGFKRMCVTRNRLLKDKYEDTFMRFLRREHRSEFVCLDKRASLYEKVGADNGKV